ncbi:hypothetical protein PR048_026433 [Dryococelus australis]|uniref:Reverse transcriptase RNase H-like domain-containing protein n=1 Tax=Dryococelus australis TaxID=614101 RepID=A0ABQ9GLC9_9NEOP|nr:hypothetical protein PR048_026433 [Dryococelus australis]
MSKDCLEAIKHIKKLLYEPKFWHIMILLPVIPHSMVLVQFCHKFTWTKQSDQLYLHHIEVKYSQIEKEILALVFGVIHFYQYGTKFVLVTDHKPLFSIFDPKIGIPVMAAARLQRYAVFQSNFNLDVVC